MKIVVPMAGLGSRFIDRGYIEPKPLISVNNKPIIEYILDSYSEDDKFVFICNEVHLEQTNMRETLLSYKPDSVIVSMPQHKHGPVYTVKAAYEYIEDEEPVIISYCDNPHIWEYEHFKEHIIDNQLDGCILTHTGFHPHTLSNTKMAFLKTNGQLVSEIKEKECYTEEPMNEHASTGVYYFKKGCYIKSFFNQAIEKKLTYNGEYYVTLVYNLLVKAGLRVGYYDTEYVMVFGTPDEVENYSAWTTITKGNQVTTEEELLKCYKYWRSYHNNIC